MAEFPEGIATTRRIDLDGVECASMNLGKCAVRNADEDKDGEVTEAEWTAAVAKWQKTTYQHGVVAVRLGGEGDVTASQILWKETKNVPEIPAPPHYKERPFTVTNGGVMSCLNAKTGEVIFRGRLGAGGGSFSSPVAVNGKVHFASGQGVISVVDASANELRVLARNELEDGIFATPAIVGGKMPLRTAGHLDAFGTRPVPVRHRCEGKSEAAGRHSRQVALRYAGPRPPTAT